MLNFYEAYYAPRTCKTFSETRWSAYTADVFYSIIRNYRAIYEDIAGQNDETAREVRVILTNAEFILW